jgi:hypothetical protein
MKRYLLFVLLLFPLFLWCWKDTEYLDTTNYSNSKEYTELENPYWDWWWHDAWYIRAEENDIDFCEWNSDAFIEWCEEYLLQKENYNNYIDENENSNE